MKKSNLKKAFALSALMAFVITGSAYAENVDVGAKDQYQNDNITVGADEYFDNAGTVKASEKIVIDAGGFRNIGTIETKILDILTNKAKGGEIQSSSEISGIITADKFIYRGVKDQHSYTRGLSAKLTVNELHIIGTKSNINPQMATGLQVLNNDVLSDVENIIVESHGIKTGLVIGTVVDNTGNGKTVDVKVKNVYLKNDTTEQDARVEVYNGSTFEADKIIADGKTKVQLNYDSSATLNNIEVKDNGNFSLQTLGDVNTNTATFNLNNITVGDNAEFKTSIYEYSGAINCSAIDIKGNNVTINLGENAKADFGGVGDGTKKDWRGDKINFDVDKLTVNVNGTDEYNYGSLKAYKNDYDKGVYIHVNSTTNPTGDEIDCSNITVVGASTNNTGNIENDLQRLAYVVKMTREYEGKEGAELPEILAPTGATVEQNPGGIDDGGKGTVDENGNVTDIETIKNPDVFGTEEVGALGLISWRNELDDMNKRLGELRDSKGEHGVWVRMVRGENDYKSLNSQYNTYQLGYDEKLSTDPHWTLGAAFSYTDGDGGYDTGSFEMDHKTFTLYGSKLNDDGSYIDIVGKYSRLNHDLRNTWGDGEYDANGYSIGVEVGKRFQQGNGFWIEPQAQLTYGHVGSANYTAGDIKVAQDGMESLIGRAGVRFGKDLDNGNIYLRASYLYDFDGETGVTLTNAEGRERSFDQDLGGGWCEVGIGTNINLSDATHLYFDIEKTYGGDITTDWKWNAGIRYSF